MFRSFSVIRPRVVMAGVLLAWSIVPVSVRADDLEATAAESQDRNNLRPYSEGPLTVDDYRAKSPSPLPREDDIRMLAHTWARVTYDYRYAWKERAGNVMTTLSELKVTASVDRAESWNAAPDDRQLMDHEQGHFDIAHLSALKLRFEVRELQRQGKPLAGKGRTRDLAVADLVTKLDKLVKQSNEKAVEEHYQYDQMTRFGTVGSAQAEARKSQRKEIEELTRALRAESVENELLNGR